MKAGSLNLIISFNFNPLLGSIGSANFEIAREWLISITKSFQIGPLATQVSVIQYTSSPNPEFDLNDFGTVEEVEAGMRRMQLVNGATRTDKARVLDWISEILHDKSITNVACS